jgi:hypothetical protein
VEISQRADPRAKSSDRIVSITVARLVKKGCMVWKRGHTKLFAIDRGFCKITEFDVVVAVEKKVARTNVSLEHSIMYCECTGGPRPSVEAISGPGRARALHSSPRSRRVLKAPQHDSSWFH